LPLFASLWEWGEEGIQSAESLLISLGCPHHILEHSRAVARLALTFSNDFPAERPAIEAGALLHDVGRLTTHSVAHAQRGADMCRSAGLSDDIVAIVERHIGAGLLADECALLGLIPKDCCPHTFAEKAVAHADNLIRGTREISIERRLLGSYYLPKKIRKRIYRLAMEMELFR
jgi:uncharacterized protein